MLNVILLTIFLVQLLCAADATVLAAAEAPRGAGRGLIGTTAKITGTVSVAGGYQRAKPLPVFKNRSFCGASVPNETLLIDTDGGLRNAVVTLRPLDHEVSTQADLAVLDNQRCAFVPHVQAATVGSELLLKNSDPILHTVHARLGKETLFNVGLPKWRQVSKRLDRVGVVRIDCDVLHTWMSAAIVVTDTPFFTVTDRHGRFVLDGLPLGAYEMAVWHERLGARRRHLRLSDSSAIRRIEVLYSMESSR